MGHVSLELSTHLRYGGPPCNMTPSRYTDPITTLTSSFATMLIFLLLDLFSFFLQSFQSLLNIFARQRIFMISSFFHFLFCVYEKLVRLAPPAQDGGMTPEREIRDASAHSASLSFLLIDCQPVAPSAWSRGTTEWSREKRLEIKLLYFS